MTSRAPDPSLTAPLPSDERAKGKRYVALGLAALFILAACGAGLLWFVRGVYQTLPSFDQLQNIEPPLLSRVLGSDGQVIHEFSIERRSWVPLNKIPKNLQNAVVAIEDRRFYHHWGIDVKRILGAVVVDIVRGGYAQGASTLTQQLARNVYLTSEQSMVRKAREALTAVQLEAYYTKPEILELYLNQVYLGAGVYGMQAASQRYFGKDVADLSLNECAVLAGVIQIPEYHRPDKKENLARITERRASVLRAMRDMGFIDKAACAATLTDSIPSNPFRVSAQRAPYFIEMIRQDLAQDFGDDKLYNGGLTINTTLDHVAQDTAEAAVRDQLRVLQRGCNRQFLDSLKAHGLLNTMSKDAFMAKFDSLYDLNRGAYEKLPDSLKLRIAQVSVVALDVKTGAVRVLIGGRNFLESKFNRATQARRQPGSAFKPFVYTVAMDSGFTPASVVLDQPITLKNLDGTEWRPENYDGKFYGPVSLRMALYKSINLPAIQVITEIGPQNVVAFARSMGLQQPMDAVPALAIGACQATPMEMARAYAAYPNSGALVRPYFVESVYDKRHRLLRRAEPESHQVMRKQTAFLLLDMMCDVVRRGTAAAIPGLGFVRPAAGKTGTTNSYSDAWFVGFTPQVVCAVWVGVDERRSLGAGVTGASGALPIWVRTMQALHRRLPVMNFEVPDGIVTEKLCQQSHKIATRSCSDVRPEYLAEGSLTDSCDIHGPARLRRSDDLHRVFSGGQNKTDRKQAGSRKRLMF